MSGPDLATTFLHGGADYERFRPGFPVEAADYCLPEHTGHVLDLGAGTGKFTELLTQRAKFVTAVDPSTSMLAQLRTKLPSVTALQGTAEAIPLPDGSQNAVTVAQAFHWFDRDRACQEISRVLRPGGTLALLWNGSDPRCAWDIACARIAHTDAPRPADTAISPALEVLPGFDGVRSAWIPWTEEITSADYVRRWLTVSTFLAADESTRTEMIEDIDAVLDADPETSGRTELSLPQLTLTAVYRKNPSAPESRAANSGK